MNPLSASRCSQLETVLLMTAVLLVGDFLSDVFRPWMRQRRHLAGAIFLPSLAIMTAAVILLALGDCEGMGR
jgi:hypothetical protein